MPEHSNKEPTEAQRIHNPYDRPDLKTIADWIPTHAKVLDLGCGSGGFLKTLKQEKQVTGYGIELDAEKIAACIENGINVIQTDLDQGLADFDSNSFDYVVLSLTLQAVQRPRQLLQEMLRVGEHGIVTFPNFAFWRNRMQLLFNGHMPVSDQLPYKWYNTPNIHLCTINDFKVLCSDLDFKIDKFVAINGHRSNPSSVTVLPNLMGEIALTKFSKNPQLDREHRGQSMTNNDILRRLRFALDLKDSQAAALFSKNPHNAVEVDSAGFRARIAKEEAESYIATTDPEMAAFLDGLIAERRGMREDAVAPPPVEHINKNEILQKLRIAFALRDEGMLKVLHRGGSKLTKSELSALFRKRGHKHYRECGNQVLRAFLMGLIDRPTDMNTDESPETITPAGDKPKSTKPSNEKAPDRNTSSGGSKTKSKTVASKPSKKRKQSASSKSEPPNPWKKKTDQADDSVSDFIRPRIQVEST